MKKLLVGLFVFVATFALANEITLGVHLELSGRMAVTGSDSLDGIRAALIEQDTVTVNGTEYTVKLSVCDNASTPEGAIACANRFVDEGVLAVLGSYSTSHSIPAANILQPAGIIMVSTGSTNPHTTQIGDYIFRIPYTDNFQGQVAAQYVMQDVGATRVAIFRQQDDDYSVGLAGFFDDAFEGATTTIDYTASAVDFSAQINDLRSFQPDMIYYTGFCAEAASLVPQLRQQGFANIPILGGDASDDAQCPEGGGEAFNEFYITSFGEPEVLSGAAAERAEAFGETHRANFPNSGFTGFTLAAADAYKVVLAAIEAGDSVAIDDVRDALQAMEDFPGVTGDITFLGTDGTPANRIMGLYKYVVSGNDWEKVTVRGVSLE